MGGAGREVVHIHGLRHRASRQPWAWKCERRGSREWEEIRVGEDVWDRDGTERQRDRETERQRDFMR